MTDPIVERLTSYAASVEYEDLPSEVVRQVKRLVIDSMGCGLAAGDAPPVRAARELALEAHGSAPATLLGSTDTTTPDMAAFVNGAMVRYLDFNDSYNGKDIAHPSDNIPAVLAAAEAHGRSGRELIAAVALAYEVQAAWADSFHLASGGAWDQAAYAAISAPLGAGKVIGLTVEQLAEALRISVVSSMTLGEARRGTISHWKAAAVPNAGRNGVFAAMLARRGMTGPPEVFSGSHGFFAGVTGAPVELAPLAREDGNDRAFRLMESRFKRFPAGFVSQTAIEGAIEAREALSIADADDIDHVHIRTFESGKRIMAGDPTRWRPETTRDRRPQHSLCRSLRPSVRHARARALRGRRPARSCAAGPDAAYRGRAGPGMRRGLAGGHPQHIDGPDLGRPPAHGVRSLLHRAFQEAHERRRHRKQVPAAHDGPARRVPSAGCVGLPLAPRRGDRPWPSHGVDGYRVDNRRSSTGRRSVGRSSTAPLPCQRRSCRWLRAARLSHAARFPCSLRGGSPTST